MNRRTFIGSVVAAACGAASADALAQPPTGGAKGDTAAGSPGGDRTRSTGTLLVCGGAQVLRLDLRFAGETATIVSRTDWQADRSKGMPPAMVPRFQTTDDCKPIDEGARMLVTSSGGAVAIVDRATGDTQFHAAVPNAHSADALPHNRVVVAASDAPEGDRLMVFDRAAAGSRALFSVPLNSAHGAVWMAEEQTLWALGFTELQAYDLVDWQGAAPSLKLRETFELPSEGGHDLSPIPHASAFIVTTNSEVLTFDRKTHRFAPYAPIARRAGVKSVGVHPTTGRVVFIQADRPEWWSRTIRFLDGAATLSFPTDRLYKARWAR